MTSQVHLNCEKVRQLFENREAIYVEKGALRMRVSGIRCDVEARGIEAQVEELPTPGLQDTIFHAYRRGPLRWSITAGYLTAFSENFWSMGYGGWSLYFAPDAVAGVVRLASTWPAELDPMKRYERALRFLRTGASQPLVRVFPD